MESDLITIIGGADGPTSIFWAGKIGHGSRMGIIIFGIAVLLLAVCLFSGKRE